MATRDDTQIPRQALQQRLAVQKVKSAMQAPDSPLILTFSLFGRGLAERWTLQPLLTPWGDIQPLSVPRKEEPGTLFPRCRA